MPEQTLLNQLEIIHQLHLELLEVSQAKTELVKKGDMENLQQLLKLEQKLILEIDAAEKERQKISETLVPAIEKPSLEDCLAYVSPEQQKAVVEKREELKGVIAQIELQNNLNYELLQQSLHYVHMSLNLFHPKEETINYGPPKGKKVKQTAPAGMFQTKA